MAKPPAASRKQGGLTLVELVVTILILAIALVGVTLGVQYGTSRSADTLLQMRTVALAQAYLDEVLGKRFDEESSNRGIPPCHTDISRNCTMEESFGPDGSENRAEFDDVDDYHGLDEGYEQINPLQDANGVERQGYDNFRVRVDVRYINLGQSGEEENLAQASASELDDEEDAKLITVFVSHSNLPQEYSFSAYKSNF